MLQQECRYAFVILRSDTEKTGTATVVKVEIGITTESVIKTEKVLAVALLAKGSGSSTIAITKTILTNTILILLDSTHGCDHLALWFARGLTYACVDPKTALRQS